MASQPKTVKRVSIPSKVPGVDKEKRADALDQSEFQREILEIYKSIDWKLWEMLKSMQRLEEALGAAEIVPEVEKPNRQED